MKSVEIESRHKVPYDMQIKLLMIGDSSVGKTCLLLRYANDTFSSMFITTIGIDFKIKNVMIDNKRIKLQIWDTAGQERFRTITTSYFRGAQGIFVVYDVTERDSFKNIANWLSHIEMYADVNVDKILIGNKCDATDNREVSYDEGKELADKHGIMFFETSAKDNVNVSEAFNGISSIIIKRLTDDNREPLVGGNINVLSCTFKKSIKKNDKQCVCG